MGKRFTATEKWEDVWFSSLANEQKLFWIYLLDKCDNAGIWEKNFRLASFFLGFKIDDESCTFLKGKVIPINDNKWFIPKFILFQYGELTETCKPHIPILKQMEKYDLKGYLYPLDTPKKRIRKRIRKGKGKEQGTEQETSEEEIQKLWISTYGKNPSPVESKFGEALIQKFGYDKARQIMWTLSKNNFRNIANMEKAISESGEVILDDFGKKRPESKMSAELQKVSAKLRGGQ